MLYGKYTFGCRWRSEAVLPYYKGSTFRGVFGLSLKKIVCAANRGDCKSCLLKGQCVYAVVFETSIAMTPPEGAKIPAVPHPYVIEPPMTSETQFSQGDTFCFNLILFGKANDFFPYFLYAFERMGNMGIGRKVRGARGKYTIEQVEQNGQVLYTEQQKRFLCEPVPETLAPFPQKTAARKTPNFQDHSSETSPGEEPPLYSTSTGSAPPANSATIRLQTPLRLKFQNRLTAELPFHLLVRAMLRRADSLLRCHSDIAPDLDFHGMIQRAQTIETARSDLRWFDWKRYSGRQDRNMLMGGILGTITYHAPHDGALDEFIPLIQFCEKTHIGKQTAFGLGRIILQNMI